MNEELKSNIKKAAIHCGYSIIYVLFILPFELWKKATVRLAEQSQNGALKMTNIGGPWPFFSFYKTLLTEFTFDFMAFISYFLGVIVAVICIIGGFIMAIIESRDGGLVILSGFGAALASLVAAYYLPIVSALLRDTVQLLLLPLRKTISWFRKPAQHLDLNVKNEAK